MPKITSERVGARFEGGPELWKVALRYDSDVVVEAFGEQLSGALEKLSARVRGLEQEDSLKRVRGGGEDASA